MQIRNKTIGIAAVVIFVGALLLLWTFFRPEYGTPAGLKKLTGYNLKSGRSIIDFEFAPSLIDSDALWVVNGSTVLSKIELDMLGYSACKSRSKGGDRDFIEGIVFSKRPGLSSEMGDFSVLRSGNDRNHYIMISEDGLLSAHWFFEG